MNPFSWRGPAFLLFFGCLSALSITFLVISRRFSEDGPPPPVDLSDPYLLAYLRAGTNEALRVGVVSLLDRNLLVAVQRTLRWSRPDADRYVRRPIERELLELFKTGRDVKDVFSSVPCSSACANYAQALTASAALPTNDLRRARRIRFAVVLGVLLVVGCIKILIGMSRNAPDTFLVVMTVSAAAGVTAVHDPFRTRRGDRLFADVRLLFAGLRSRAASLRSGRGDSDVTMLAAVFGLAALPAGEFVFVPALFPRARDREGTGCGSCDSGSCGGGGDCGGGCGGCGD